MSETTYETIERYLANQLSPEEVQAFEAQLLSDTDLAEQLQQYLQAQAGIDEIGHEQMTTELSQLGRELIQNQPEAKVRRIHWGVWASVAAAVALLIAVALFQNRSVNPQQLYAAHFELLDPPASRGESVADDSIWQEGVSAFGNADYPQAIQQWKSLPTESYTPETYFYLGFSYLMDEQTQQAIDEFANVSAGSPLAARAEWYTALAYLKLERLTAAKQAFQAIADADRHYQKQAAQEVLEELE